MSITALTMLTDSLRLANVIDELDTPTAEQGADGLRTLNQLMAQWDGDGIKLGWFTVPTQVTVLPIDQQDERAVKYNLAHELAGEYGIDPMPSVSRIAFNTHAQLGKRYALEVQCSLEHLPAADFGGRVRAIQSGGG